MYCYIHICTCMAYVQQGWGDGGIKRGAAALSAFSSFKDYGCIIRKFSAEHGRITLQTQIFSHGQSLFVCHIMPKHFRFFWFMPSLGVHSLWAAWFEMTVTQLFFLNQFRLESLPTHSPQLLAVISRMQCNHFQAHSVYNIYGARDGPPCSHPSLFNSAVCSIIVHWGPICLGPLSDLSSEIPVLW